MAAFMLLIHLVTCSNYELHRDEMLYVSFGSHLSWGFASTPPFISFLSFIIIHIFGYNAFFVKLFPALFGAFIVLLTALFTRELGGKRLAVFLACFAVIISTAMLRTASLFMPVIFELFFWMMFLFFLLKLITTQNPVYWIWIGISFGLAFLNKYSVLFLGFSAFIALLISEHRKLLLSKYLLFGIAAALIIMSPNIIWQLRHNLAVATHMRELYSTQLVYVSVKSFLLDQVIMNFSAILIWGTGLAGILLFGKERKSRVFVYILLLVILIFLIARGKSYYTLGVYPMMFAFGGYILEKYLRKSVILVVSISLLLGMLLLPIGLFILPQQPMKAYCAWFSKYITSAPMRNENNGYYPIPQDFMDMTGWDELARMASGAYNELTPAEKESCTVYANNYGQAGAFDFYGKKYGLPTPVCMNDSYIFWAPDSLTSRNFIVSDDNLGDIPQLFGKYRLIGQINNECFRENGLQVYLCQDPTPLLNGLFKKRIREHKKVYGY
jgi:hypothetical protein